MALLDALTEWPVPDELGHIRMDFTPVQLREFIGLLNMNNLRSPDGRLLTFRLQQIAPGEVTMLITSTILPEVPL